MRSFSIKRLSGLEIQGLSKGVILKKDFILAIPE